MFNQVLDGNESFKLYGKTSPKNGNRKTFRILWKKNIQNYIKVEWIYKKDRYTVNRINIKIDSIYKIFKEKNIIKTL